MPRKKPQDDQSSKPRSNDISNESRNKDEALIDESWIHVMKEELDKLEKNLRQNYQ